MDLYLDLLLSNTWMLTWILHGAEHFVVLFVWFYGLWGIFIYSVLN